MNYLLSPTITYSIYSYLTWSDLLHHPTVPDRIWAVWCYKFGQAVSKKRIHKRRFVECLDSRLCRLADDKKYGRWSYDAVKHWRSWNDKDFVYQAIKIDGNLIYNASSAIKANRLSALTALHCPNAIRHISPHFLDDSEFMLDAITINIDILQHCHLSMSVALHLFNHQPHILSHLHVRTEDNLELMHTAVAKNGLFIKFASPALSNNLDLVIAAITQNPLALEYAPDTVRKNMDIVRQAVIRNGLALQY